jgi:4-hydroxy-tetrahydrodipicolinate reductase
MGKAIRVLQIGLGDIGLAITRILSEREDYAVAGAADINAALKGKDLGELAGLSSQLNIPVRDSITELVSDIEADIAILTTTSRMEDITPQVMELVDHGLPVVSTCEELVFPKRTHPELTDKIDTAARGQGVAVISTGVNPGFLMDFLPIVLSRIARTVEAVRVERVQDAGTRREAFQRKVGAGLAVEQFEARVAEGNFGHAGLVASVELLAAGLGWELETAMETIEPVISDQTHKTDYIDIKPGQVAGVHQVGRGLREGQEVIHLVFRAAVGEAVSYDRIQLKGDPKLESLFPHGVPGDAATGAITVNAIPLVMQSKPGLRTMADIWPRSE